MALFPGCKGGENVAWEHGYSSITPIRRHNCVRLLDPRNVGSKDVDIGR